MPVSSPSYFPPQRSTDRIVGLNAGTTQTGNNVFLAGQDAGKDSTSAGLIIIGHEAAGAITGQNNAVIIGVDAATALTTVVAPDTADDAPVIIGYQALQNTASAGNSVVIGSNNFNGPNFSGDGLSKSVAIGCHIAGPSAAWIGTNNCHQNVMIGYGIYDSVTLGANPASNVLIGAYIASGDTQFNATNAVVIGEGACNLGIPDSCVVIGAGALPNAAHGSGAQYVIAIGAAAAPNVSTGAAGIFIGHDAGNGFNDTQNWIVLGGPVGSNYPGATAFSALANPQTDGAYNIGLGAASAGLNLGIASARNIVCLYNGTVGTANPTGGGYFYVDAGALHWVGSSGTDTLIAPA